MTAAPLSSLQQDGIRFVDQELRRLSRLLTDAGALMIGVHEVVHKLELPLLDLHIDIGAILLQVGDALDAIQRDHYGVLFPATGQITLLASLNSVINAGLINTPPVRQGAAGTASRAVPATPEKAVA